MWLDTLRVYPTLWIPDVTKHQGSIIGLQSKHTG